MKSKTSEGLEESYLADNKDSSQLIAKPNRRPRPIYTKGKGYNQEESGENSASNDNMFSVDESSANHKNKKKQKKIGKSGKGTRRN